MSLPPLAFVKASLKRWQRLERRDAKRLARDKRKVKLRRAQVAKHRLLDAKPTVMYDSVNVSAIPATAPAVAGYTAGRYPTYPELVARWPKARHLSIAVASRYDAECLDVEPGDATPQVAAGWVRRQQARGIKRPVVYCSVSAAPGLLAELARHSIARTDVRLWTAHFTHQQHICGPLCGFGLTMRADATQWTDKALGRVLDESLVDPGFWS